MTKRKVKIIVASEVGSGKSTIIDIIEKVLNDNGIPCTVNDMDRPNPIDLSERINHVSEKIDVAIDAAYVKRMSIGNEVIEFDDIVIHNADGNYKRYNEVDMNFNANPLSNLSLFQFLKTYSSKIVDNRTRDDVLIHTAEEFGELATECKIAKGRSYKTAGPDGIFGESVDIILCALDMIYVENPDLTEDEFNSMVKAKCEKWYLKVMGE